MTRILPPENSVGPHWCSHGWMKENSCEEWNALDGRVDAVNSRRLKPNIQTQHVGVMLGLSTYLFPLCVPVLRKKKANPIFLSSDGKFRVDRIRVQESSICPPMMLHLTVPTCSSFQHDHPPTLTRFHLTVSCLLMFVQRSRGCQPRRPAGPARAGVWPYWRDR